jgi:hypothetical protein
MGRWLGAVDVPLSFESQFGLAPCIAIPILTIDMVRLGWTKTLQRQIVCKFPASLRGRISQSHLSISAVELNWSKEPFHMVVPARAALKNSAAAAIAKDLMVLSSQSSLGQLNAVREPFYAVLGLFLGILSEPGSSDFTLREWFFWERCFPVEILMQKGGPLTFNPSSQLLGRVKKPARVGRVAVLSRMSPTNLRFCSFATLIMSYLPQNAETSYSFDNLQTSN